MVAEHDGFAGNGAPGGGGFGFELGAFDLDGTVLRHDQEITGRTRAAVRALRERGTRLVVATGRRYESALEHASRLGFEDSDPVICYGGSMVRRMNGETLLHRTLPVPLAVEALGWASERGLHARVLLDGGAAPPRIVASRDVPAGFDYLRRFEEPDVSVVDSPAQWLRDNPRTEPTKLVFVDSPGGVEAWLNPARDAFRGRLFVTRSLPHYVEIGGVGGTKSAALAFLCGRWGIDPRRAIAFGDADNDVDMLRFVGHGVAVGGMTEEVREAADAVAPSAEEDGVAVYLEKLLGGS